MNYSFIAPKVALKLLSKKIFSGYKKTIFLGLYKIVRIANKSVKHPTLEGRMF
jgi:hypothetical protein